MCGIQEINHLHDAWIDHSFIFCFWDFVFVVKSCIHFMFFVVQNKQFPEFFMVLCFYCKVLAEYGYLNSFNDNLNIWNENSFLRHKPHGLIQRKKWEVIMVNPYGMDLMEDLIWHWTGTWWPLGQCVACLSIKKSCVLGHWRTYYMMCLIRVIRCFCPKPYPYCVTVLF